MCHVNQTFYIWGLTLNHHSSVITSFYFLQQAFTNVFRHLHRAYHVFFYVFTSLEIKLDQSLHVFVLLVPVMIWLIVKLTGIAGIVTTLTFSPPKQQSYSH